MKGRALIIGATLVSLLATADPLHAQETSAQPAELRETMHEILDALGVLLPRVGNTSERMASEGGSGSGGRRSATR